MAGTQWPLISTCSQDLGGGPGTRKYLAGPSRAQSAVVRLAWVTRAWCLPTPMRTDAPFSTWLEAPDPAPTFLLSREAP